MGRIIDISAVILELGLSSSVTEEERAIASVAIRRAESAIKKFLHYDPVRQTRTEFYPQGQYGDGGGVGVWEANETDAYLRRESEASVSELQMRHIPIREITNLWIDYDGRGGNRSGSFSSSTLKTEGTDYWMNTDGHDSSDNGICRDGIIKSVGLWPREPGSVKITYVAGYTNAELHGEDDIIDAGPIGEAVVQEACIRARRAFVWKKNSRVGFMPGVFTSERAGDYSYTIDSGMAKTLFGGQWELSGSSIMLLQPFVNWGIST